MEPETHIYLVIIRGPKSRILKRRVEYASRSNNRFREYPKAVKFLRRYIAKNYKAWDKLNRLLDDELLSS